jgi:hypothetical protein
MRRGPVTLPLVRAPTSVAWYAVRLNEPLDHASAEAKGEVGPVLGADVTRQRNGLASRPRTDRKHEIVGSRAGGCGRECREQTAPSLWNKSLKGFVLEVLVRREVRIVLDDGIDPERQWRESRYCRSSADRSPLPRCQARAPYRHAGW